MPDVRLRVVVAEAVLDAQLQVAAAAVLAARLRVVAAAAVPDVRLRVVVAEAAPDVRLRVGASRASLRAWHLPAVPVDRAIRAAAVPPLYSAWATVQASTETRARSPAQDTLVGRLASNLSGAAAARRLLVAGVPTASSPRPESSRVA